MVVEIEADEEHILQWVKSKVSCNLESKLLSNEEVCCSQGQATTLHNVLFRA